MMIHLVLHIIGYLMIHSMKYLYLKPLEQECIRTDKNFCSDIHETFQFTHGSTVLLTFTLKRSQQTKSLKNEPDFHTFIDSGTQELVLHNLIPDSNGLDIAYIDNINVDDKFTFIDENLFTLKIIIRIRIMNKLDLNLNIMLISTITKTTLKAENQKKPDPTPDRQGILDKFYENYMTANFDLYTINKVVKLFCDYKNGVNCKQMFVQKCGFKNKNSVYIQNNDMILNNYLLNGIIERNDYKVDVTYKLLTTITEVTSDYLDSLFAYPSRNIKKCQHIDQNGFMNIECECKPGYYGMSCSKREYNIPLDCRELNICGTHGKCKENTYECECDSTWTGKYCTKILIVTEPVISTKLTTTEESIESTESTIELIVSKESSNTTESTKSIEQSVSNIFTYANETTPFTQQNGKILNTTEYAANNSKKSIIIGVVISSIILIALIAAFVIYYIKFKN